MIVLLNVDVTHEQAQFCGAHPQVAHRFSHPELGVVCGSKLGGLLRFNFQSPDIENQ